jgi:hypothetical protein
MHQARLGMKFDILSAELKLINGFHPNENMKSNDEKTLNDTGQLELPVWKRYYRNSNAWCKKHEKRLWLFLGGLVVYDVVLCSLIPVVKSHPLLHTPWTCYGAITVTALFLTLWPLICFRSKKSQS